MAWTIRSLNPTHNLMMPVRDAASAEGFRFIERCVRDWTLGYNRFDGAGETLLGAFADEALVGLCGLSRDPYAANAKTGRLRHLYVVREYRRRGLGSDLTVKVLDGASETFDVVRLRTDTSSGVAFYEQLGFAQVQEEDATHLIEL